MPADHDVARVPVGRRVESATPLAHDTRRAATASTCARERVGADGEELCAVIEARAGDPARRQATTGRASLVEHRHVVAALGRVDGRPSARRARPRRPRPSRRCGERVLWAAAACSRVTRREELEQHRLNVVACSTMNPCAAPEMTTSSAFGSRSASSSLSPRGVRMSWLPTITSAGTVTVDEQVGLRLVGGEDRPDLRDERMRRAAHRQRTEPPERRHQPAERPRPDHPAARPRAPSRPSPARSPRRPARQQLAPATGGCDTPCTRASASGRARGASSATICAIAPPIDAPTTCAVSTPASSSTAMASSAICSRL